jgi:para-aminobenzoate synthetase/4-amino-4-deoxychorismate lyase
MPTAVFQDGERWLRFEAPQRELVAHVSAEVVPALEAADAALAAGSHVAGFLAYEAARAFGLPTREPEADATPLLWLGVFGHPKEVAAPAPPPGRASSPLEAWRPGLEADAHAAAVGRIQAYLAAGDTYQVNLTFPLEADLVEDPEQLFSRLVAAQNGRLAAYLDLGRFAIASASPELFFRRDGDELKTRPMKGTAPRGSTPAEDERLAARLQSSEKERAENLMIVDMLRNDLGRIAETGSVAVPALFSVERYPTLLQMTSEVRARSGAPLSRLLEALFPCASVTGAPKRRTMEIITALEPSPRGVYTGALGWAAPGGTAAFNVAIRTAVADRRSGRVRYGVGSGIVADSVAEAEHAECMLKARVLVHEPFDLLETLAHHPGEGYRRLAGHLARLSASARHFGFALDERSVKDTLERTGRQLRVPSLVRLLVDAGGRSRCEVSRLGDCPSLLRVAVAQRPVERGSIWLYHKTTRRDVYEAAAAERPDCDDVLLWNEAGELTEATRFNVLVDTSGERVTPPLRCGLLAGVEREALLAAGRTREAVVPIGELRPGHRLTLINSVRGACSAVVVG